MLAGANSYGESGGVAMSKDSGATWSVVDATRRPWQAVAITGNGARPVAVASDGGIYGQGDGSELAPRRTAAERLHVQKATARS